MGSDTVSGNVSCDASCPLVDKPDILHVSYMTPYHVTTRCPVNTCIPRLYLLIHSCSVCWCPYVLHHFFLAKPCGNVTQCTCIQFSCAVFLSASVLHFVWTLLPNVVPSLSFLLSTGVVRLHPLVPTALPLLQGSSV